jgi:hypothetical protein
MESLSHRVEVLRQAVLQALGELVADVRSEWRREKTANMTSPIENSIRCVARSPVFGRGRHNNATS